MSSALVTDARLIMALPIIRSLGRAKISVVALETSSNRRRPVLGFYSRYTRKRIVCESLIDGLRAEGKSVEVIFPVSGDSVYAVAQASAYAALGSKVALPQLSSIELANDKARLNEMARELGVPVPETFHPEQHVDLEAPLEIARCELQTWAHTLPFPVIIKYRYGEGLHFPASKRYYVAHDPEEFGRRYLEIHKNQAFPVVQEYLPGNDYGAAVLCDKFSRIAASFTYRSIRQRPKMGGPTTRAVSESLPPLVSYLGRICKALGWYGIAMGDFRLGRDGQFKLLEVNPRFWGSLALAIEGGVDFPLLYYRLVTGNGELQTPPPSQRDGASLKFSLQDVFAILEYARDTPAAALYTVRELAGLVSPGVKDALFQFSDPGPGVAYLLGLLKGT